MRPGNGLAAPAEAGDGPPPVVLPEYYHPAGRQGRLRGGPRAPGPARPPPRPRPGRDLRLRGPAAPDAAPTRPRRNPETGSGSAVPGPDRGQLCPGLLRPVSYAYTTACTRSRSPSFARTFPTCVFTVVSLTTSSAAISAFDSPRATCASTSRSRSVSVSSPGGGASSRTAGSRDANRSSSRRVTLGATIASPAATIRIACTRSSGGESFSRNPLAPARTASITYSSRSNVVRISTFGS